MRHSFIRPEATKEAARRSGFHTHLCSCRNPSANINMTRLFDPLSGRFLLHGGQAIRLSFAQVKLKDTMFLFTR